MWYYSPFDSLEYRRDGLLLTSCGLGGRAKHFLPRSQVDHISFGRHLNIGLTLIGIILLITGAMLMITGPYYQADGPVDTTVAVGIGLLSTGCFFLLLAAILLVQQSLIIATKNGTFVSRAWCQADRVEELGNWVITGISSDDQPNGNEYVLVVPHHQQHQYQYQPQYQHQQWVASVPLVHAQVWDTAGPVPPPA